jgi:hypothetical protein
VGAAGPWTLLAAGLVPVASRVAADTCRLDTARDEAYIPGLYAPGLRRAGDLRSAAMLTAPADLCLLNTGGSFDSTSVARAYRGSSASAPRIEDGDMTPDALAQWVAGE